MLNKLIGICAVLMAMGLDQTSKAIVSLNMSVFESVIPIFPGFNLVFVRNYGISFGLLGGVPWWGLVLLAIGISVFLFAALWRSSRLGEGLAYGMIIGGALGNVLDRIRLGGVTDFLDFYIGTMHWPSFNLADIFIFSGVALLLFTGFRTKPTTQLNG